MGSSRFDPADWATFSAKTTIGRSASSIFSAKHIDPSLDPSKFTVRESRDSTANPESTAIIAGLDVTGSMGILADSMARSGLKTLFTEIYSRKPVPDPHVLFAGIGDARCDAAPLQVSQFEADIRLADQLVKLWLEGGGGGNDTESYDGVWWFAHAKTSIDCWLKRRQKGFLFTIGDEMFPVGLPAASMHLYDSGVLPESASSHATVHDACHLLQAAQSTYHVFHVVVEEGSFAKNAGRGKVIADWESRMPQHVLPLSDHTKLAEVIVSAIQVVQGSSPDVVSSSWTGSTAVTVGNAIRGLAPTATPTSTSTIQPF